MRRNAQSNRIVILLILYLFPIAGVQAASFECGKAIGPNEKLICSDPTLSKLDEDMAAAYKAAIDSISRNQQLLLRDDQRWWLKRLNEICDNAIFPDDRARRECVRVNYQRRIASLNDPYKSSLVHFSDAYPCPPDDSLTGRNIVWSNVATDTPWLKESSAIIDLQEWGGKRAVVRRSLIGNATESDLLNIGPVGSSTATEDDQWEPIKKLPHYLGDGDHYNFLLTDKGPYLAITREAGGSADHPPPGKVYFRINQDSLELVCVSAPPILSGPTPSHQ